jgi:hypothetical protein
LNLYLVVQISPCDGQLEQTVDAPGASPSVNSRDPRGEFLSVITASLAFYGLTNEMDFPYSVADWPPGIEVPRLKFVVINRKERGSHGRDYYLGN